MSTHGPAVRIVQQTHFRAAEGGGLTDEQKLVLAYLIKSEWANEQLRYTILLTPDNNHYAVLGGLEKAGLIAKHAISTAAYP